MAIITQAQEMIRIYAEIVAMDEIVVERSRQLLIRRSDDGDHHNDLVHMRLVLVQLEKVGERIAYWNARVRALVKEQLPKDPPVDIGIPGAGD